MKTYKSTNKQLVEELIKVNVNGRLDEIIQRAKDNWYHDYKQPEHIVCGKVQFVQDSCNYPELKALRSAVMDGEYDEKPDEDDKAQMRKDVPAYMWPTLGLNPLN